MKTDPKIIAKWANKKIDEIAEPSTRKKVVEDLADRCGRSVGTMYKYLEGARKWPTKFLEIMAEYFGEDPPGGLPGRRDLAKVEREPPDNVVPLRPPIAGEGGVDDGWIRYPVFGVTVTESFRVPDKLPRPSRSFVKGDRSYRYPNAKPMAWESGDESMAGHGIFVGTAVFGVDFHDTGGMLENDMHVVVERIRGSMVERSIRVAVVYPDKVEFQSRSSDPAHEPFVCIDGRSDGDEVRVLTILTGRHDNL